MTIGFIGLGVMGEPMCRNLAAKSDEPVVVFDVRPEPIARLVADGASAASSIADVADRCDVVLLSLPGGPELEAVVAGGGDGHEASGGSPSGILANARPGQLIVDHSTAPVALTRQLADQCAAAGVDYCDAPIARTRQAAIDGTLSIMVGCAEGSFGRIEPILRHMAADVTRCGGVSSGQVTKILNNMMLFQNVRAIAEAHAIATGLHQEHGDDLGLDIDTVFEVITGASGGSFALANHGRKSILPGDFPLEAFSTRYAMKDLSYAIELAEELGVDAVGARTVGELLASAVDAGFEHEYFPVVRRML